MYNYFITRTTLTRCIPGSKRNQIHHLRFTRCGRNRTVIGKDLGKLNTLYNYEIPKNGTKVKLLDMNGNEYEIAEFLQFYR